MRKVDLENVAKMSMLEFNEEQTELLQIQLDSMLKFATQVKNFKPNKTITKQTVNYNDLREDTVKDSLPIGQTMLNAKRKNERFFIVPITVE